MKHIWLLHLLLLAVLFSSCEQADSLTNPVASVVKMEVVSAAQIYLAGHPVALNEIHDQLGLLSAQTEVYVSLKFAMDTPMDLYNSIMQQVRDSDIKGLAMSATDELDEEAVLAFYRPTLGN
ncbi:MAG: hypothetical protein AAF564_02200 [Bacteroidota bacterium]